VLTLPTVESCYFCDLIVDLIADPGECWNLLAEDDLTLTLLNGRQYETGQSVVVPRRHAATLMDLRSEEMSAIMVASQRLARVLESRFDVDGILLYQNNGEGSGQEVPHFHLHIVPRQAGSDWGLGPPHIARFEQEGRPARFDVAQATDEKLATVERIRNDWPE